MQLRPLAEADLEFVRTLRNANRQFFFTGAEISPEQQRQWFRLLPSRPIDFFVIEHNGAAVGTISAKRSPDWIEIGNLLLVREAQGQGLMRQAVNQLTAAPGRYFSEVKPDNRKSLAVFAAAGFSVVSSAEFVRLEKIV
jgi:RimJ/RimL family protein N-acetyltransferase